MDLGITLPPTILRSILRSDLQLVSGFRICHRQKLRVVITHVRLSTNQRAIVWSGTRAAQTKMTSLDPLAGGRGQKGAQYLRDTAIVQLVVGVLRSFLSVSQGGVSTATMDR